MIDRGRGYDVAVLGAGASGAAVAYALARRRVACAIIDVGRGDVGMPASTAVPVRGGTPADIRLALRSAQRFPDLQEAIGPIGYRRAGGIVPALTQAEAEVGQARAAEAHDAGLPVAWLPREEVLRREPGLNEGVTGAVYSAFDGIVDVPKLVGRLLAAASRLGTVSLLDCGYVQIAPQSAGFQIRAGRDQISARRVLVASGEMLRIVGRQIGVELPLRESRRRICVTDRAAPMLRHLVRGIYQNPTGEYVLDPPVFLDETGGSGDAVQAVEAVRRLVSAAVRVVPSLGSASILHAPLRDVVEPADGRPAVGRVENGVYVALAGLDQGAVHCPLIGEIMGEVVARGKAPDELDAWSVDRFGAATAGALRGQDSAIGSW